MTVARPLYHRAKLQRMLSPRSIAIVGATPRAGAFGERVLANCADYAGRIHLVNGRYDRIGERPCHSSVRDVPEPVDLAVLAVAREAVEGVVADCIAAGAGGAIVFASGYAETGQPERIAQQQRLAEMAREAGLPLIGPNCIGITLASLGARISFMPSDPVSPVTSRAIGIVSQSGALGYALGQATQRGVSISHVFTSGNSCDVDMADLVAYLADEPDCAAIALVFEGTSEPLRLMRAAELAAARGKPLVVCKLATGETGAAAAMSHTGSLAGQDAAWRAAFDRAGAAMVDDIEALLETAAFLAKAPSPSAAGVAVLATSGGAAIMAADKADACGIALPQPGDAARAVLEARIPEFGSPRNPVDVTAQVITDPESLPACARAMLADDAYGALVLPIVYTGPVLPARAAVYQALAAESGKPILVVWLAEWLEGPGAREMEAQPDLALFRSMSRCFAALGAWQRLASRRAQSHPAEEPANAGVVRRERAAALLAASDDRTVTEGAAKQVLALYGVPAVAERLVQTAEDAVAAAAAIGFPVALKVESPDLPHKTEAGVVRLNVSDTDALRAAYAAIIRNAGSVRIAGVLVQRMVPAGVEILIGGRVDPLFGPLLVVGFGGVLVELLRDQSVALAPVSRAEARAMLERLKGAALLRGFRGAPAVDLDSLAAVISGVADFLADHAGSLAELDINPLICAGREIVAVDALIVRR